MELTQEISESKAKQVELLEFTSKLTEKNVELQHQIECWQKRCDTSETEMERVRGELDECRLSLNELDELKANIVQMHSELDEKRREADELRAELESEREECFIMRKKLTANINDLKKQLKAASTSLSPVAIDNESQNQSFDMSTSSDGSDKQYKFDLERLVQKIIDLQDIVEEKNEMIEVLGDHLKKVKLKLFDANNNNSSSEYKFDDEIAIRM